MLSIIICLGLSGWFILSIARDIATRKISETDMQTVRRIAEVTDTRMKSLESALRLETGFLGEGFGDKQAIAMSIAELRDGFPEIAFAFIAAPSGIQFYRSDTLKFENVGEILSFQMAKKGETVVSDIYPEPLSARPVRTITIPIRRGEFVIGIFSVDIDFGGLVEIVHNSRLDGEAKLVVVSSGGRVVAHTSLDRLKSLDLSKLPPVEPVLEGIEGSSEGYTDEFGVKVLGTYTPIDSLGWGVIVERPLKGIAAEVSRLQNVVLGSAALALVFSILAGWIVSRRIADPITRLAAASEKVAKGDFSQHIETTSIDETGALTESFNRMVAYLRTFREDLQKANATLEAKVAQRTADLEVRTIELAEALEKAKSADQLKSAFLATMSHELRTPLNSIIGFTGILQQQLAGPLNAEQIKQMGMIRNSARHLLSLINDVLDISKIEAGQLEVVFQTFDMRTSMETVLSTIAPMAEKKGLSFGVEMDAGVGTIVSDKRRVEQILMNLLSNAVKFTERGEIRISCKIEGDELVTSVGDSGCGIRAEDINKLFEPFRQVETGITRQHEGTGLGLSISKKLVALLSGTIHVESEWGKGSVFTFSLPLRKDKG
jgi:signal transduction histidine kinase